MVLAALVPEMSAPQGAVNSWGQGTSTKAMARRIKRERSAAPTADVKKEAGPPLAKKPKDKSDGKGGKNTGARYTVNQASVRLCFSWNFGGGTCGELSPGSPCPAGRVHKYVSVGQALGEAVPTDVKDREAEGIGTQEEALPSLIVPGGECSTFLRYFSGPVKFGLGEAISAAAARRGIKVRVINRDNLRDGTDLLADEPFSSDFTAALNGHFDGFHSGFSLFFLQPRQVSARWSATCQGPSVLAWTSIEQSGVAARSGERNMVGNTVCGLGSRCPVWVKETWTVLHSDARESG